MESPNDKYLQSILDKLNVDESFLSNIKLLSNSERQNLIKHLLLQGSNLDLNQSMRRYYENRFTCPSDYDQRRILQVLNISLRLISDNWLCPDLSPVCNLGTVSAISGVSPYTVMQATHGTEVVSDALVPLAIYMSKQLRVNKFKPDLCNAITVHKEVRAQKYAEDSGLRPYFNSISLISAYKNIYYLDKAIITHISYYVKLLTEMLNNDIINFDSINIYLSYSKLQHLLYSLQTGGARFEYNTAKKARKNEVAVNKTTIQKVKLTEINDDFIYLQHKKIRRPLKYLIDTANSVFIGLPDIVKHNVNIYIDLSRQIGINYYNGIMFDISLEDAEKNMQVIDGGEVRWLKLLSTPFLSLASGTGIEFILHNFSRDKKC